MVNNDIMEKANIVNQENLKNGKQKEKESSNNHYHRIELKLPKIIINKSPVLRRKRSKSVGEGFKYYASYSYYAYKDNVDSEHGLKENLKKVKEFFDPHNHGKRKGSRPSSKTPSLENFEESFLDENRNENERKRLTWTGFDGNDNYLQCCNNSDIRLRSKSDSNLHAHQDTEERYGTTFALTQRFIGWKV